MNQAYTTYDVEYLDKNSKDFHDARKAKVTVNWSAQGLVSEEEGIRCSMYGVEHPISIVSFNEARVD